MAGDWIMIDHELPDKEEVLGIHERTGVEIGTILGRLQLLWCHADKMTTDGILPGMGLRALCSKFGGDKEFWLAVADVGWLKLTDSGCEVPDFLERFGQSAKARKLDTRRKQADRAGVRWSDSDRTDNGHDTGQQPDQNSTPEPRTDIGSTGAFSKLTVGSLRDTAKVLSLVPETAPEALKRNILGAAERALEKGKNPPALFNRIVKGQLWNLISNRQQQRADDRLRKLRQSTGPPSSSVSQSLAASLSPPE